MTIRDKLKNSRQSTNVFDLRPPKREHTEIRASDETIDSFINRVEVDTKNWMETPEYKTWFGKMESWALANFYGNYRGMMEQLIPTEEQAAQRAELQRRADELGRVFKQKRFDERFDPQ